MLRAGLVLALVLFALGGTLPDQQIGASGAVAASIAQTSVSDLCGGGWGDRQAMHAPCHACRNGVPMLPAAPCGTEPAFGHALSITYVVPDDASLTVPVILHPPSRGPPALA